MTHANILPICMLFLMLFANSIRLTIENARLRKYNLKLMERFRAMVNGENTDGS